MNFFLAILAGAVQGLTEFLPISSTGHLIIFEKIFSIPADSFGLAFDASLHLGTLLAVAIFFFKDYLKVLNFKNGLFLKLIIGTIPAAVLGLLFESAIETTFRQLWIVGAGLILFSFVIIFAEKTAKMKKTYEKATILDSILIGFAQSLALVPGVSRSGSTISAGLFRGLNRQDSARFAFILSGPIIAGAGIKKFADVLTSQSLTSQDVNFFLIGIASSFIFGYLTIKYFLKYLSNKNLTPFILYRVLIGAVLIVASLVSR